MEGAGMVDAQRDGAVHRVMMLAEQPHRQQALILGMHIDQRLAAQGGS